MMPIVISICQYCQETIQIDTAGAIVLTGNAESVWRAVTSHYRAGDRINVSYIADVCFMSYMQARRALLQLGALSLIARPLKRAGGVYRCFVMTPMEHPKLRHIFDLAA